MPEFEDNEFTDGEVIEDAENEIVEPDMYRILLHNDHYTSMDFVVEVLQTVFHKQLLEAIKIMLDVHRKGIGIVGTYILDVARTKTAQVREMAEAREFPLRCTFEKV
jgi:ATP-dependent Clp protease adaptor protein ClpS